MEECDLAGLQGELANQKLINKELSRSVKQFTYLASHDLQEPLRKIKAFGERLAKDSTGFGADQRLFLERLLSATDRMQEMLDGLLELSRKAGTDSEMRRLDLKNVVTQVVENVVTVSPNARFDFVMDEEIQLDGDEEALQQLFRNILANSVKFCSLDPIVTIRAKAADDLVYITISDNGIGFGSVDEQRIFEPFVRLVGRTEFPGVGMGLAVANAIVQRHGGKIAARSEPGSGTSISICLPQYTNRKYE